LIGFVGFIYDFEAVIANENSVVSKGITPKAAGIWSTVADADIHPPDDSFIWIISFVYK
jgi:hypothetical protein